MNKRKISDSFSKASKTYEASAPVQNQAAELTLRACLAQDRPISKALEIGCGTGLLTRRLVEHFPKTDWLISDLSSTMVDTCRDRLKRSIRFIELDGENPTGIDGGFDLIASSLAYQWFSDLSEALRRQVALLNEGGEIIFATLGKETFAQWRTLLETEGVVSGLHEYPDENALKEQCPEGCQVSISRHVIKQPYENGLSFVRALKKIGAHTPKPGYRPLSAGTMRHLLHAFDRHCKAVSYDILICRIKKEG